MRLSKLNLTGLVVYRDCCNTKNDHLEYKAWNIFKDQRTGQVKNHKFVANIKRAIRDPHPRP